MHLLAEMSFGEQILFAMLGIFILVLVIKSILDIRRQKYWRESGTYKRSKHLEKLDSKSWGKKNDRK